MLSNHTQLLLYTLCQWRRNMQTSIFLYRKYSFVLFMYINIFWLQMMDVDKNRAMIYRATDPGDTVLSGYYLDIVFVNGGHEPWGTSSRLWHLCMPDVRRCQCECAWLWASLCSPVIDWWIVPVNPVFNPKSAGTDSCPPPWSYRG